MTAKFNMYSMKTIEVSEEDVKRLKQVESELQGVQRAIEQVQSQLVMLQQQLWYVRGKRDQVVIELSEKYGFDPTQPFELDEEQKIIRVREPPVGGESDG